MPSRVTPARMAAFRVLLAMERSSNTHSDDLLRAPAIASLTQADRNLTTALVMGVLRWQLALDKVAARYLQRKSQLDPAVAIALRLGAFQLLKMDRIPAHAALAESVELTKVSGHAYASGMVNAVLDQLAHEMRAAEFAGPGFASVEHFKFKDDLIAHVEVYFGRDLSPRGA